MSDNNKITPVAPVNIGSRERIISTIAGSLLLYFVMSRRKKEAFLALAGGYLAYRGISGHCPLYSLRDRRFAPEGRNINVRAHVVVSRPRDAVYAFWRKLENLNLFMQHVEDIREIDDKTSSWTIKIPGGLHSLQWEAEIVKEEEGKEISWLSKPGASIENAGKINFSDTPARGTRIDALISYRAPFGKVGEGLSRLFTPLFRHKIAEDIYNFKYYLENATAL